MSSDPSIGLMNDLFEICEGVVQGRIAPAEGFKKIEAHNERDPTTPSMLLDVLAIIDVGTKDDENQRKLLIDLAKLAMNDLVPEECVRVELDCLEANTQANRLQIIRTKTKLFFKQSKFNLLREESEGYSKLITELLSLDDTLRASTIAQRMLSLIGTFSLDPNRALDILLEAFERLPARRATFVEILKEMQTTAEYLQTFLVWKFTIYQTEKSETPFSLYRLAAALIEEQLVEMDDILKYLAPSSSTDLMETHKARAALASVRSKKAETILASSVAVDPHKHSSVGMDGQELAQITGISFAAVTGVQEAEDAKLRGADEESRVLGCNQKVGLVTALLEDGEWERARRIMDCMPEHYVVQASKRAACAVADLVDATISDLFHLKCAQGLADTERRREERAGGGPKWERTVSSWDDFDLVFELLSAVGPRVAYRSKTLTKLVRLCSVFFEERAAGAYGTGVEISNKMMDLIDEILLPGLSLSESNVALSEEIWSLISQFPYEQRYRLYGRWKREHTTRHPELTIERGKTIGRTKYVIKRLSKDTVKMMGRILGKLAHSHPSFVFDYLLGQVQTFDNLIHPVVDALRFLTNLELDVLMFCVLEQLSSPSKESLKASDGTTSSWLISLATLVGALLKKYTIELAPVLDYVSMQLRNNKSADLLILNEMLHAMAGIEKATQATQEHIEALSGGELLRQEAGSYGSSIRNKKAALRLRDAILKDDLAVGLSILVGQQRDAILYQGSKEMPLKLTGEMADQCRDTLVQFSSFLLENMRAEEYAKKMPPIDALLSEYSLPVDAAFFLARPAFRYEVQAAFDRAKRAWRAKEKEAEAARREAETEEGEEKDREKEKKERRQMDSTMKLLLYNGAIDEVVTRLADKLEPLLKKLIRAEISAKTYVLFWMLESYDLEVPTAAYEREGERMRKAVAAVGDSAEMGKTKRAREEERLRALEYKLKEEHSRQTEHVERVRAYLGSEKNNLFKNTPNAILSLLHTCILPRAMFGESDAIFAAKFVLLMHSQKTSGFQTLFFTDKVMCDILPVVSLLSENEAHSLGRCLQLILSQHAAWHEDAASYERECAGTPGFQLRLKKPVAAKEDGAAAPPTKPGGEHAKHDMHAKLLHKWQSRVSKSLQGSLNNTTAEYVHLRNCIVVATKLLPCFPLMTNDADNMEKAAAGVRDREKGRRDDLSLKAASYVVLLKTRKIQLRDSTYFGCKNVVVAKAAAAAAPAAAKTAAAPATKPRAKPAAAAAASAASAAAPAAAAAKNGVKRAAAAAEEKKERAVKKEVEVKTEVTVEVEGPSLPPALANPTGSEEKDEKPARVTKKTSTLSAEGERVKKRREIDVGGVAARTLGLASAGSKKPRNELDGAAKKEDTRNGSGARKEDKESRREESSLSSRFKRETKREEEDGEDGEVPPSPKREEDRSSRGSNGAEAKERERESKREKEKEKERDRDEKRLREEAKEKMREREKEKKRLAALGSGDEKATVRADREKEREREKRKQITIGDEFAPSLKKSRKEEKEKESKREREDSKGRRRSPSREKTREKERGGGGDRRSKEGGKERAKSPEKERSRVKRTHNEIKF